MTDETNKITVTDSDIRALKVAKKQEQKELKDGWQYYKVNNRLKILVPYGSDGKPTKQGLRMIEIHKQIIL